MAINTTSFNLQQPDYLSAKPGPYRAQPSLFEPDFLKLKNPLASPLDTPNDYFSYFALDNDFSQYASFNAPANQFDFSTGTASSPKPEKQLRDALKLGADYMPAETAQALEPVAKALGFASAKNFVNALRHLPEASQEKVLQSMPHKAETAFVEANTGQLKTLLKAEAHHLVFDAFAQAGAKSPQLNPPLDGDPEGLWEAPQLLSIYNNVKSMASRFSPEVLKDMLEPDSGEPLTFERRKTPESSPGSQKDILQALSTSMKVAEAEGDNKVILYNSAFTTNPEDIVKSDDVQAFLSAYDQVKGSQEPSTQVESLQQMLNHILPENRKLNVSGTMDRATEATLAEFEGQQFLNQAADIIGDDKTLPREDKQALFSKIDGLKQAIFKEGYLDKHGKMTPQAQNLFNFVQDVKSQNTNLTPASKSRLTDLASFMESRVSAKELNPELLERVVSNWFGMIDSGERKDFSEQVINHELGHFWEQKNNVIDSWKNISFQDFESQDFDHNKAFEATLREGENSKGYASRYAKLNPSEDFAESFRLFTRDPDKLIQQNLLKYVVMAGATGAHQDDYAGLIQFAEKNGYAQADVAEAIKSLRGRQSEVKAQDTTALTTDTQLPVEAMPEESSFSPAVVNFSQHNKTMAFSAPVQEQVEHTPSHNVGATAQNKRYAFDLNVSNYFPGIEENLNIQAQHVGDPSQPGFVLDNLANHTENMEKWRLFSKSSRASHRFVEDFKTKGVGAFSPEVQAQIPAELQQKLQDPQNKAIYLVLAKLRSSPELAADFAKGAQASPEAKAAGASFFQEHFGDMLEGLKVPDALVNYLSQSENLMAVTGSGGKSLLAAETIEKNAADVVIQQESNYQQAVNDVMKHQGLASPMASQGYLEYSQEEGFASATFAERSSLNALNRTLSKLGFGSQSLTLNRSQFQALTQKVLDRLNQEKPQLSPDAWAEDQETLKQINQILLEELMQEVPELQSRIKADTIS